MQLDRRICDRARKSRDARFDGKFFIAVTSTRIYCRPICPARSPKDENIRYYPTAAAAQAAGFRPCLRCRPEASPGTPAWLGTSGVVSRALRLITEGALDREGVDALADRLGVTARHLRRLFVQHLGATPIDVALTRRIHFAKKLLDETRLPISDVAFAAGFGSLRRFNGEIRRTYSRTPTELRRRARGRVEQGERYQFRIAYRPPYDWDAVIAFLAARATPGVERVEDGRYARTIAIGDHSGTISVSHAADGAALLLDVRFPDPRALLTIVERVRRMFDIGADPAVIAEQLSIDPLLKRALAMHPGIRTPGAWDPFELSVRAILGQQISVSAATTIAGRVAERWGSRVESGEWVEAGQLLGRLFPIPAQLAEAPLEEAGIIGTRAASLRALAQAVLGGAICFDGVNTVDALQTIPGIGEWTAQYVAMRALSEPDAFPSGDLVLRRMAGDCSARELDRRSDAWRPWRAYAVMLLWQAARDVDELQRRTPHAKVVSGRGSDRPRRVAARAALG
ncbi:MAG TPA: AlkA N-terminal domain-containing protein [Vicinamibacterales bacterium]|nr:AlkA N-terminal domain-containing protein [Vicinamibacterales bacterium]